MYYALGVFWTNKHPKAQKRVREGDSWKIAFKNSPSDGWVLIS
jgi:hypothetical protein